MCHANIVTNQKTSTATARGAIKHALHGGHMVCDDLLQTPLRPLFFLAAVDLSSKLKGAVGDEEPLRFPPPGIPFTFASLLHQRLAS